MSDTYRSTLFEGAQVDDEPADVGKVLVVDDDELSARLMARFLRPTGHEVDWVSGPSEAQARLTQVRYDVVLTDLNMPEASGIELIRSAQAVHPGTAFVLITALPEVESAIAAVRLGVAGYLQKPIDRAALEEAVAAGVRESRAFDTDQLAHEALAKIVEEERLAHKLRLSLEEALSGLRMAYQPLLRLPTQEVVGCEALLRFSNGDLSHPGEILDAAERLDLVLELGRTVRARVAEAVRLGQIEGLVFVNLHGAELADPVLLEGRDPLTPYAASVVLEITERQSLEIDDELLETLARLRSLGYRIAIDDLGTGYSSLASMILLRPDIVKLDMSLTRAIDRDPMRQRLVDGLVSLCRDAGIEVVAEGVETEAELATIVRLGCDLAQGFLLGRPEVRHRS